LNALVWLLVLVIPFGPLLLDLHGFYDCPLQKTILKSVRKVGLALLWLAILICGCAIFFRLSLNSRSVLLLFGPIGTVALIGLILLAPLMLVVAAAIKMTSPDPVIFLRCAAATFQCSDRTDESRRPASAADLRSGKLFESGAKASPERQTWNYVSLANQQDFKNQ
jgi:hypothetical protein